MSSNHSTATNRYGSLCAEVYDIDKPFGALSGGWQRLMLIAAAARLEEPNILILDEPTNHLDLANITRWNVG